MKSGDEKAARQPGWGWSVAFALVLHGAILIALVARWSFPYEADPPQPLVQATLVGIDSAVPQPDRSAPASQAAPNAQAEKVTPAPSNREVQDSPDPTPAAQEAAASAAQTEALQAKARAAAERQAEADAKAEADKAAEQKAQAKAAAAAKAAQQQAESDARAEAEKAALAKAQAKAEADAKAKKAAEDKAKAEADAKAKKAAEDKAKADADAKAKKAAEDKAKAEADAKAKKAAQDKAKAEADAKAKKAAQDKAKADRFAKAAASASATDDGIGQEQATHQNARQGAQAVNGMQAIIHKAVEENWYHLASAPEGATVQLQVKLVPSTGELISATVTKGSGSDAFDREAIQAVRQAAPFAELAQQPAAVQQEFRQFRLNFGADHKVK